MATVTEWQCQSNLDIYDSPQCDRLATQAAQGRHLRLGTRDAEAIAVQLCEDDYPGWLRVDDLPHLQPALCPYQGVHLSLAEIQVRLPQVIDFAQKAMAQPNYYLWGGTVGPNYDCSGLIQAAFISAGIWVPRDAYQQEAFAQKLEIAQLYPGDLVFFGPTTKATHVGLYLGDRAYIHSSGIEKGRNGIGIDYLTVEGDPVTQTYYALLRGAGRVVASYRPQSPNDANSLNSGAPSRPEPSSPKAWIPEHESTDR